MKIEHTEVFGFNAAIRGMRNAFQSHDRSDSYIDEGNFIIGENDMYLCHRLIKAGPEHAKFLRYIHVQADFTFPRYFWSEADTYKFLEKNSESTMHKLLNNQNDIMFEQFIYDDDDLEEMIVTIKKLNKLKEMFEKSTNQNEKNHILARAKRILPEGFLQKRTIDTNYQEVWNMYKQRVLTPHKLKEEWVDLFGGWCEDLPYFKTFFLNK